MNIKLNNLSPPFRIDPEDAHYKDEPTTRLTKEATDMNDTNDFYSSSYIEGWTKQICPVTWVTDYFHPDRTKEEISAFYMAFIIDSMNEEQYEN